MRHYSVPYDSSNNPDWPTISPLKEFGLPWENRPPPETTFRAVWNEELFQFRFDCIDEDLVLAQHETPEECVLGSDRVEIFFAPDLSLCPYYCLEIDPLGNVFDYKANYYRKLDRSWKCAGLKIEAFVVHDGYTVTASLPLSTLRNLGILDPNSSQIFAGVHRAEFTHRSDGSVQPGWMTWVPPETEKPDFHVPTAFGVLHLQDKIPPQSQKTWLLNPC